MPGTTEARSVPMSLADVRHEIDRLDDRIIELLALRQRQVARAAAYKRDEEGVRAPDRRRQMIERLRTRAAEVGVDPDVVSQIWNAMIDAFTELEMREHKASGPQ
ncbi:chorismate mutase [Pseudonocardia hierapolitana]|nr:chorismate mutase [Pseudonocardia hierapolitana]